MDNSFSFNNNIKTHDFYNYFQYHDDSYAALVLDDILETEFSNISFFSSTKDKPFSDQIEKFVSIIFDPEDVIEIRLIPSKKSDLSERYTYFDKAKKLSSFANNLKSLSTMNDGFNVYVSINPKISKFGGGTGENVLLARCIFVDFDNLTVDEAIKRLRKAELPPPTLIVFSGKGCHFYWMLKEPLTDLVLWRKIQLQFIKVLNSDPSVTDAPRVMRLPSFQNINHPDAPLCFIHEENRGLIYNLQELIDCLPEASEPLVEVIKKQKISVSENKNLLETITGDNFQRAKAYSDQFSAVDKNRNVAYFKKACDLFEKFNITEEQTFLLLAEVNEKQDVPLDAMELSRVVKNANTFLDRKKVARGNQIIKFHQKYFEKPYTEILLSEVRHQMVEARIKSLSDTGVFFDGSPPGTGKSTADIEAIKKSKTSLTVLPTHEACVELVDRLSQEGISATAYPKLNPDTCMIYGTIDQPKLAQKIQASGLNVGTSLCFNCKFSKDCIYQKTRHTAKESNHTVTTHARVEATDFNLFNDKQIVFVHENPISLLRPYVEIENLKHLEDLIAICKYARNVVGMWEDPSAIDFLNILVSGIEELINILANDQFFEEFENCNQKDIKKLAKIKILPCRDKKLIYKNGEYILCRAMTDLKKYSDQNALHLAIGYSFGGLKSLFAKVEEYRVGDQINFRNFLVGFWHIEMPNQLVWFEDGSSDVKMLKDLTGLNVIDKTPIGKIKNQIEPIQFVQKDITKKTTSNVVKSVVRGLLAKYKKCNNIGIICHQCHVNEIESLPYYWKNRIKKISYFHSGQDRASNEWLDCDLLIVLGTPRVPPSATRNLLLSFGKTDAAKYDSDFVSFSWTGKNENGDLVDVIGKKYSNPDWKWANSLLVKETLRQAIGRARSITEKAIPVVLISSEPLDLILSADNFIEVSNEEDDTLQVVLAASSYVHSQKKTTRINDKSPNTNILGHLSYKIVTSEEVHKFFPNESLRNIQRRLSKLVQIGLLFRISERKGFTIEPL